MNSTDPKPSEENENQESFQEADLNPNIGQADDDVPRGTSNQRENTASELAKIIVWTFTLSIAASFLILAYQVYHLHSPGSTFQQEEVFRQAFELFKTVSAVMSGPIGFVLGFDFRESPSS